MKISKLFAITLQSKTRLIFFLIAATYNVILGLYLKDFLVLSPAYRTFYLLSVLPTLFLLADVRSKAMRSAIFVMISLSFLLGGAYALSCRRMIVFPATVSLALVVIYFGAFVDRPRKDSFVKKLFVFAVSVLIAATLFSAYNFVFKPKAPYLANGRATLWTPETEQLADEICGGCKTDEEKVQAFHDYIMHNFEYDDDYYPLVQYFNVRKTLSTHQGICFDFAHLFAAFFRSQNIPCYVVDGTSYNNSLDRHVWSRVYFNGSWWNVDVTNDICAIRKGKSLYGFRELESFDSPDSEYYITKIY